MELMPLNCILENNVVNFNVLYTLSQEVVITYTEYLLYLKKVLTVLTVSQAML